MAAVGRLRVSERAFERQVLDLAKLTGWTTAHFRAAMNKRGDWRTPVAGDGKGFFDLVLMKDRVLFVELKTDAGRLTPEQLVWRAAAEAAGATALVWRPSMWPEIEATLKAPVGRVLS